MRGRAMGWVLPLAIAALVSLVTRPIPALDGSEEAAPPTIEPSDLEVVDVDEVLEKNASAAELRFCRQPGYTLTPSEVPLCSVAPAARPRCPEFEAACERSRRGAAAAHADPPSDSATSLRQLIVWLLQRLSVWFFWGLCAAAAALAVWLIRGLVRGRRRPLPSDAVPAEPPGSRAEPPSSVPLSGAAEPHLDRARVLARAGDYAGALFELHLGILLRLDALGVIDARPGRTNGDYVRELGPNPELRAAFGEVSHAVEAVQFGAHQPDAAAFEQVLSRAAPLLGRAASSGLVLLCAGLAAVLSSACGSGLPEDPRGSSACGTSASGYSILCDVLALSGNVQRRYRPLDQLDDSVDAIIVLPHELGDVSALALEGWVEQGGLLVLAAPLEHFDRRFEVHRDAGECGPEARLVRDARLVLAAHGPSLRAPRLAPDAVCGSGAPFVAHDSLGEGRIVFLATPGLLSNASLLAADNASLMLALLGPPEGTIEIVGGWTRESAESPLSALRAAGLLPWLLQLALLGLVYALYRGLPFGRLRSPPDDTRRRFVEHAVALGGRWAEAGASRAALGSYATWAFELLRERTPTGAEQGVAELSRMIAEKTGRPATLVAETLERAQQAHVGAPVTGDEAEHLVTLRTLGHLLEEIGGPR